MENIVELFGKIMEQYGIATAVIITVCSILAIFIWKLLSNSSKALIKYIETKLITANKVHLKAIAHRKNITPEVREELSCLAKKLNVDRTMLVEYSNGSQNLVGLPFLYLNATNEFVKPGVNSISYKYQRTNTSIFASVIEDMEILGYLYIENVENVKDTYPVLYGMMKSDKAESALLYPLYGMDNSIGFIEIMDKNTINKKEAVPTIANAAQRISSLLNFDEINDESR